MQLVQIRVYSLHKCGSLSPIYNVAITIFTRSQKDQDRQGEHSWTTLLQMLWGTGKACLHMGVCREHLVLG